MSQQDQALVDHLSELRKRLIWTLVFFIVCLCVTFAYVNQIYDFLVNDATRLFPELGKIQLTVLGPGEILKVYLTVAGLSAVGLTLPFILFQVWGFIKPALSEKEARLAFRFLPAVFGMFLLGICFGYFFIFPMLFKFLVKIGEGRFHEMFTASSYFSFMTNMVLPFGLIFEMPVAVMFLTRIGIIAPQTLTKIRKYAYLAIIVIASMISPPDFVSHLSVAAPMVLLYEISILISKWMFKIRQRAMLEAELRFAEESEA